MKRIQFDIFSIDKEKKGITLMTSIELDIEIHIKKEVVVIGDYKKEHLKSKEIKVDDNSFNTACEKLKSSVLNPDIQECLIFCTFDGQIFSLTSELEENDEYNEKYIHYLLDVFLRYCYYKLK